MDRHGRGFAVNNSGILDVVRRRLVFALLTVAATGAAAAMPRAPQQAPPQETAPPPPASRQTPAPGFSAFTTVVLDPAHGGSDSGAHGSSGAVESEVVLDFARAIRVALEAQGLRVLLTREGNQGPSFDERSSLVNGMRDTVFVSLHVASTGPLGTAIAYSYNFDAPGPDSQGSEPRARSGRAGLLEWDEAQRPHVGASRHLAELVQRELAQKFSNSPPAPSVAAVRQLRTIAAPAIAVEVSSVAVPDVKGLTDMAQPLADALARGISDFRRDSTAETSPREGP